MGGGGYVGDLALPGMLHMAVLRSPHAHARLLAVEAGAALSLPGVSAVFTGGEVRTVTQPFSPLLALSGQKDPAVWALACDRVRYVGDPVVVIAGADRYLAEDALDLVRVAYDPLPPVVDVEAALAPDAELLYDDWGDNVQARLVLSNGDVARALRAGEVVIRERLRIQRQAGTPLETRGCLASYESATGVLTLRTGTQKPHPVRTLLARTLELPERRVRVIAPPLGGGFGVKGDLYAEEILASLLAMRTGRPVKWVEDRREHFLSTVHSREQVHHVTVAASRDGILLAMEDRILADFGAWLHSIGPPPSGVTARMLPGPYRLTDYRVEMVGVVTNKVPAGSYRGYGNPEANFVIERVMDLVAEKLGMDPAEVRRRNLLGPAELPYRSAAGSVFDSGDYPASLQKALDLVEYEQVRARQSEWREEGRLVGVGLACYVEGTGLPGVAPEPAGGDPKAPPAGYERVVMTLDQDGCLTLLSGLMGMGQGLATALAQVAADELGLHPTDVRVVLGDTEVCPYSPNGSSASRSLVMGAPAVMLAAGKLRDKLRRLAAHNLEVAPEDLEFAHGSFNVRGAADQSVSVRELAARAYSPSRLPPGEEIGLHADGTYVPSGRPFAYGTHAAVVEVKPATGEIDILHYVVVDDCGTVVNPMIVRGQVHGAVAQGLAGALYEDLRYDADGQLLTTSFMDYLMPTAVEIPELTLSHLEVPSTVTPGGYKGVGEGGIIAPPATIANAVADALRPLGVAIRETPITPAALWAAIQAASGPSEGERVRAPYAESGAREHQGWLQIRGEGVE